MISIDGLQQRLAHVFTDVRLLERALTHRSFGATHNERLEFLGDAVLNLAVGQLLYLALDAQDEGSLSRARANLVRQGTLHKLALDLDLAPLLRLGEGEARSGGAKRASILADAVEAIIGAVYLDAGFEAAHGLVQRLFKDVNFSPDMAAMGKDPKTALQEWLQGKKLALPGYSVAQIAGVQHAQTFEVLCEVPSLSLRSVGSGVSRRAAEQAAAAAMLELLPQQ